MTDGVEIREFGYLPIEAHGTDYELGASFTMPEIDRLIAAVRTNKRSEVMRSAWYRDRKEFVIAEKSRREGKRLGDLLDKLREIKKQANNLDDNI